MDTMDKYKIQKSLEDVLGILDSAPIQPDMIPETNYVQLTNRMPIAHLAIERGLKALISDATRQDTDWIHGLNKLFRDLKECAPDSSDYLGRAFEDAVGFFGYNVNRKGFGHFRSLEDYLAKVGTEKAFEELRYWAIGQSGKGESPIPYISTPIHRELLCALWCLFLPNRRETVSERVERKIGYDMFDGRHLWHNSDDVDKERSIRWYGDWLVREHVTCGDALRDALQNNFAVKEGDELVRQTLRDAYDDLLNSKDPAVLYFMRRLTYLPRGSQPRVPDAIPEVEWLHQEKTSAKVVTPAGTCLGFIDRYADGGWGIEPAEEGLARVEEIAVSLPDAKNYLVNRLTKRAKITANGESKLLRIVCQWGRSLRFGWTSSTKDPGGMGAHATIFDLEFWDASHGLNAGEEISVVLDSERIHGLESVLEGTVATVAEQNVSIDGTETFRPTEATEP